MRGRGRPGLPRIPEPLPRSPEPQIPAPKRDHGAALRISYGGCEWCGRPQKDRGTSCAICAVREENHRKRMNALAEREAQLRIQLLEQQLRPDEETST